MTPSKERDLRRRKSVYTDERLAEIRAAVRQWYFSLEKPRNKRAKALAETSVQTITRWRDGGGLKPEFMARLWRLTQNPTFLLTEIEKELSERRSFIVPEGVQTRESWDARHGPEPPLKVVVTDVVSVEEGEPSLSEIPVGIVAKMVTANLAIITGGLLQIEELLKVHGTKLVTKQVRQRAGALIFRLIAALKLESSDFEHVSMAETDPEILASWAKVLAALSDNRT